MTGARARNMRSRATRGPVEQGGEAGVVALQVGTQGLQDNVFVHRAAPRAPARVRACRRTPPRPQVCSYRSRVGRRMEPGPATRVRCGAASWVSAWSAGGGPRAPDDKRADGEQVDRRGTEALQGVARVVDHRPPGGVE